MDQESDVDAEEVAQIMRRTEAMGLDPQRVVRALDTDRSGGADAEIDAARQARSWLRRAFARAPTRRD